MSDFHPKAFKWTEMMSLLYELNMKNRNRYEDLFQLRQYACQKYKANPLIEDRVKEYMNSGEEMFKILVDLFGEP